MNDLKTKIKNLSWYRFIYDVKEILEGLLESTGGAISSEDISDATVTGKSLIKATNATSVRTLIGAGTSNLTIGTTATTASAGNHTHPVVTTTVSGQMSSADKTKLDGIIPSAVLPTANAGTGAIGTSLAYSRQDHVHPLQASVATLTTGRTFALTGGATGTSAVFNGSANASIPVILATPTATVRGGVLKQTDIADLSGDTVTVANYNALLSVLRNAGIM